MNEKKHVLKFEDYIEPKAHILSSHMGVSSYASTSAEFKLDRIFPRNINFDLNHQNKEYGKVEAVNLLKSCSQFKMLSSNQSKVYKEFISLKECQLKSQMKRKKIDDIFSIRSINLLDKQRQEKQINCISKTKCVRKDWKPSLKYKDNLKGCNVIHVEKSQSPDRDNKLMIGRKNSTVLLRTYQNRLSIPLKPLDVFQSNLEEYFHNIRFQCSLHGLQMQRIQNYARNSIAFYVGKGNNAHLIKDLLKKRWWWTINEEKGKKVSNFIWTQLKEKSYYIKKQRPSTAGQGRRSISQAKIMQHPKDLIISQSMNEMKERQIHNHFQNNEFLGNKKALYYNMNAFYETQGKNVFDYLPVTFHVKRYNDQVWNQFTSYYKEDCKVNQGEDNPQRLWIVKPGQNTNRGNGITVYSDYEKMRQWVENQISGSNNPKKTLIIQKYIDRPFLYNKRKFDIRCYMLLVRLKGKIKGYWYKEGYIRTSCFDFQLDDTDNEFIHLTNDAIQVNSEKYGKFQDGNKLSFQNFQKYLDSNPQNSYNLHEQIIPKLKQVATDCIVASHHLLGTWNGLPTFQIFGLDFMIDQNFKPWLIEINTNPCLETTSTILEKIIPKMVDNAFKLSLDLFFPPPNNWPNSKRHYLPKKIGQNLFELIFDQDNKNKQLDHSRVIQMGDIQQDNSEYEQTGVRQRDQQIDGIKNG